ncbi:SAF domain protein (plasmid) [Xylanimonas cellulosilytica DSM 15894]|uniref:SAF domain protein n=1 Tax=Xylanimonas cellulosilytica (strain DSM 15894 / JCM 12276 / CECT 5975 / KCTC 9989 / LMG 20990 / NBRC 107835 / XIL07) TaxID=446471 RepID=D1C0V0_XYLCX|nr:SAF domain-containing protein [Xylanimonas cellulosilytica]ACZ32416.1 SAF domain protein [Xylanimonas cellulosilytica DSM 15894]
MTTTTPAPNDAARASRSSRTGEGSRGAEQIAPPPKLQRRPVLVVASVATVCLGALVSVWAFQSTSDAQEVLAVRETVVRGQVITKDDLMSVRISVDPALHPVATSQSATVVGKRAALDLVAGGVVTAEQVTDTPVPADGQSVVGLNLTSAMLPAQQIRVGDKVRIVSTSGQTPGVETDVVTPTTVNAEVVGIASDDTSGNTILNVQVPHDDAPAVADRAAAGRVAVVLDSSVEN